MKSIELKELTKENWIACAGLKLAAEQEGFLAPNVYSIAESKFESHYVPRVIYAGDEVVGFLMYCVEDDPPDPELYWLFRFMIASEYQGRGYGKSALQLAIDEIRQLGATRMRTGHKPGNEVASRLYKQAGFHGIGLLDDGDVGLELIL